MTFPQSRKTNPIQTQSNPISPTPKGVKQKSDAGSQRSDICFLPSVFAVRHPVDWLWSMAPMIAIGFEYNGIFECRKQARHKILFFRFGASFTVFRNWFVFRVL